MELLFLIVGLVALAYFLNTLRVKRKTKQKTVEKEMAKSATYRARPGTVQRTTPTPTFIEVTPVEHTANPTPTATSTPTSTVAPTFEHPPVTVTPTPTFIEVTPVEHPPVTAPVPDPSMARAPVKRARAKSYKKSR